MQDYSGKLLKMEASLEQASKQSGQLQSQVSSLQASHALVGIQHVPGSLSPNLPILYSKLQNQLSQAVEEKMSTQDRQRQLEQQLSEVGSNTDYIARLLVLTCHQ